MLLRYMGHTSVQNEDRQGLQQDWKPKKVYIGNYMARTMVR